MVKTANLKLYLAVKDRDQRSKLEDSLVLDGINVRTFATARELWTAFEAAPARMVISERRFPDGFGGIDLTRNIRTSHLTPYVYSVVLSALGSVKDMKEALAVGVDDYLVRPHNKLQLRSRVLVGIRWLNYIDSLTESRDRK